MPYPALFPLTVAVFALTQSSYDVGESDGQLDVTIELITGALTFDVVVMVTSIPDTATGSYRSCIVCIVA